MKSNHHICALNTSQLFSAILLLVCLFQPTSVKATNLDSLRFQIRSLQNKIEQNDAVITQLSQEFNTMNAQIYEYKTLKSSSVASSLSRRLSNALRVSHQLADTLDFVSKQLRVQKSKLQNVYSLAIEHIEQEIQRELDDAKREFQSRNEQKKHLRSIKKLEQERDQYDGSLQKMRVDEKGWEKITIDSGDTFRRLKLKAALLEDFHNNLRKSVESLEGVLKKNRVEKKTYAELLEFYKELEESLDDDQDIFDKSRIEELQDKIENADAEFIELSQQMDTLNRDITVLKAKKERFRAAIIEKETF